MKGSSLFPGLHASANTDMQMLFTPCGRPPARSSVHPLKLSQLPERHTEQRFLMGPCGTYGHEKGAWEVESQYKGSTLFNMLHIWKSAFQNQFSRDKTLSAFARGCEKWNKCTARLHQKKNKKFYEKKTFKLASVQIIKPLLTTGGLSHQLHRTEVQLQMVDSTVSSM